MSQEIPEHILLAAKDLCEYMPPNVLAKLVDYWSDEPDYLPLAQIAFEEGDRSCGAVELAEHITKNLAPSTILERWIERGVQINDN